MVAQTIVVGTTLYLAVGTLFAVWFVIYGVAKIDDAARGTGVFFRFLIGFGTVALWPFVAAKMFRRKTL